MSQPQKPKITSIIYRIFNVMTGQSYVGQSIEHRVRIRNHFRALKKKIHVNHRLQEAYNKCGKDAFRVEILERVVSFEDLDKREIHWIALFDSHYNGYNLTLGGKGIHGNTGSTSIIIDGIEFVSMRQAMRHFGTSFETLKFWVENGKSEPVKKGRKSKPIEIDGIMFPSTRAAMKHYKVGRSTIHEWVTNGKSDTQTLSSRKRNSLKPSENYPRTKYSAGRIGFLIEVDSVVFTSMNAAMKHHNVSYGIIQRWLADGKARFLEPRD